MPSRSESTRPRIAKQPFDYDAHGFQSDTKFIIGELGVRLRVLPRRGYEPRGNIGKLLFEAKKMFGKNKVFTKWLQSAEVPWTLTFSYRCMDAARFWIYFETQYKPLHEVTEDLNKIIKKIEGIKPWIKM